MRMFPPQTCLHICWTGGDAPWAMYAVSAGATPGAVSMLVMQYFPGSFPIKCDSNLRLTLDPSILTGCSITEIRSRLSPGLSLSRGNRLVVLHTKWLSSPHGLPAATMYFAGGAGSLTRTGFGSVTEYTCTHSYRPVRWPGAF